MDEQAEKLIAQQLRKPEGEMGLEVGERMSQGNYHMNLNTIEQLDPQAGDQILEIGMANGFFVKEILSKHPSIQYTGCDYSELMVSESVKNNKDYVDTNRAAFVHGNADNLPFKDQSFNKIFAINTLYFWEQPETELAEIRRVLKPSGCFLLTIRPKAYMQKFGFTRFGFTMYSQEEAIALVEKNGMKVKEVIPKTDPPIDWFGQKVDPESLIIVCSPFPET